MQHSGIFSYQRDLSSEDVVTKHRRSKPPLFAADMAEDVQRWDAPGHAWHCWQLSLIIRARTSMIIRAPFPLCLDLVSQQARVEPADLSPIVFRPHCQPKLPSDVVVSQGVSACAAGRRWSRCAGSRRELDAKFVGLKGRRIKEWQSRCCDAWRSCCLLPTVWSEDMH